MLVKQRLPRDAVSLLCHHSDDPLHCGTVKLLLAGAGGIQAAEFAETREQQLENYVEGQREPADKGLHHHAGPQLCAGSYLGFHKHHLHLHSRVLYIYCFEFFTRSVKDDWTPMVECHICYIM